METACLRSPMTVASELSGRRPVSAETGRRRREMAER
jgi:hypothetical protein